MSKLPARTRSMRLRRRASMQELVKSTPIFLVTDEQLALKGAAVAVKEMFY